MYKLCRFDYEKSCAFAPRFAWFIGDACGVSIANKALFSGEANEPLAFHATN
jgi:hypothetical protein